MRKSNTARREASERARKRALRSWAGGRTPRPEQAEDARKRALHDARGLVLREGVTYHGDGRITPWQVRRSLRGRTDQLDLVAPGHAIRTAGPRRLARLFPGPSPRFVIRHSLSPLTSASASEP